MRCRRAAVAGATVAFVTAFSAATAAAAAPALGRWSGGGSGGAVQFVVSRIRGTLVVSDLVVSCSTAAGVDGDDQGPLNSSPDSLSRSEGRLARTARSTAATRQRDGRDWSSPGSSAATAAP